VLRGDVGLERFRPRSPASIPCSSRSASSPRAKGRAALPGRAAARSPPACRPARSERTRPPLPADSRAPAASAGPARPGSGANRRARAPQRARAHERSRVDEHRKKTIAPLPRAKPSRPARRPCRVRERCRCRPPPQHLAEQVTGGPGADRAVVEVAGMRARERDELGDRSRRTSRSPPARWARARAARSARNP